MSTFCKYYKQQKQVSYDSGYTWSNVVPPEYRKGDLYEEESADCQDALLTRWIAIPGEFLCNGKNKYEREIGQYSLNNGENWEFYYPSVYRLGKLLEENSEICNNKWEGYYYLGGDGCPSGYRFVEGRGCVAVGGGGNGDGTGGSLYFKYIDPVKYVRCVSSTSTTLKKSEISYSPYILYEGIIGDCVTSIASSTFSGQTSLVRLNSDTDGVFNIPDSVTSIGNSAFWGCSSLTNISIPSSITSINDDTFRFCGNLTGITIPSGVTTIGHSAFRGCYSLTSIVIPDSVTTIDKVAFQDCTSLTSCTIGRGVNYINIGYNGETIFTGCTNLSELYIDKSVLGYRWFAALSPHPVSITLTSNVCYIGQATFAKSNIIRLNSNIDGVVNLSVSSVGISAFQDCSGFTQLNFINGSGEISCEISEIEDKAFQGCTGLTAITINVTTPPTLGSSVFAYTNDCPIYVPASSVDAYKSASVWRTYASRIQAIPISYKLQATYDGGTTYSIECDSSATLTTGNTKPSGYEYSAMTSAVIGDCVTSIANTAFRECSSLTSCTIGSGVTSIGSQVFYQCRSITSIVIPDSVTTIGSSAFERCDILTSCTIGSGVTSIGGYAFNRCTMLSSITINAITPPTLSGAGVFNNTNNCPIYVPAGSVEAYKSAWSNYASRIQAIP